MHGIKTRYSAENDVVEILASDPMITVFAHSLEGTLNEWASAADEEACRDL